MLRLAARPPAILGQESSLDATYCGAEANVAVALSGLGHAAKMVSALPCGRLGDAGVDAIRAFGVDTSAIVRERGRMGLYFLSPGAMARPSEIIYDRIGSAFAEAEPACYGWRSILKDADWLFVGGITAALGSRALTAVRAAIATAKSSGTKIAFDCNYRPSLWEGRETEAKKVLLELSREADLLFAGRRAIGLLLDQTFDDPDPNAGFERAAHAMFSESAQLQWVAATRREIETSDRQKLTPLLASRDATSSGETIPLDSIVDRIGTGDAFAAGILHGIANGMGENECIRFAGGCALWAHSMSGDFLRASVSDIESVISGSASDVKR